MPDQRGYRMIVEPLLAFLKQGMSPPRLALCVAIGVVVGNIPILGVSTLLCFAIAVLFRLNLPAIQVVQAAMAPSQILLIIPFVRLGEWMLQAPSQPLSIKATLALLAVGIIPAVRSLRNTLVHAGCGWLLVAPLAIYLLYRVLTPWFYRARTRFAP